MRKLAILTLVLMLVMPIVAQEPEAKTQWVLEPTDQLLLTKFAVDTQEEFQKLVKMFREENNIPDEAVFNVIASVQLTFGDEPMFVIPKPKEEKKPEKKEK